MTLRAEHELAIEGADEPPPVLAMIEGRWLLDGDPQAFGRPGSTIGLLATLKRVRG